MSDTSTQGPVPENGPGWVTIHNPKVYEGTPYADNPPTAEVLREAFEADGMAKKGWVIIGVNPDDAAALKTAETQPTSGTAPKPPSPAPPASAPGGST